MKKEHGIHKIVIDKLCKSYGDNQVLDLLDFEFEAGEITCIMGASGIGKTTLLRILMGLEKSDSGSISGIDENTRISAVFQEDRLCDNLTPLGNVSMVCDRTISKEFIKEQLVSILPEKAVLQKSSELSGGMRQRVAIVRAFIKDSDVILMDEPFKGLDEGIKRSVVDYILANQKGRTILFVSHSRSDAEMLGARICVLTKP